MSTILEPPTMELAQRRKNRRNCAVYLIFAIGASLYLLPFMRFMLPNSAEGSLVDGAIRIFHGQVFARDFFEVMGPGSFYWTAAFFKLFGATFMAQRIGLFVSSFGTGLLMYFLSRRVCRGYAALPVILLAATYFGMLWPTTSHHVDSNFFALLSVACVVFWLGRRRRAWLIAGGALAAATLCFHQPKGLFLFCAIALWLCWIYRRRKSEMFSSVAWVSAGFLAVLGLVAIYFWSQGALWDLIYANFLWPMHHYSGVNVVPYGHEIVSGGYWEMWAGTGPLLRWRVLFAAVLIVPFYFVTGLPALLPTFAFLERKRAERPEILLYWLCGLAIWASEFHRKDICHLVFGSPLLIVLSVYYLEQFRAKAAELGLQILAISAACLAVCNLFVVLAGKPMATRFGTVYVGRQYPLLHALIDRTTPGEEIFAYPYCPSYYVLSGTVNPTRYTLLTYNYNTPAEFREAIQTLEKRRVKWVVWTKDPRLMAGSWLFPLPKGESRDPLVMEPYLESHYNVVQVDRGRVTMELMERKPDAR